MDLRNVPWRAYEKYKLSGIGGLLDAALETFLLDVLWYRGAYQRYLRPRLPRLTRSDLRAEGDCDTYEACTGEVPIKNTGALRIDGSEPEAYWPGDRFVCTIDDVTVLGPVGPAVTPNGRPVAETVGTPRLAGRRIGVAVGKALVEGSPRLAAGSLAGRPLPDARVDTAALALPTWNNYYHWTIECLPRVRLLDMYAERTGERPDLLVPADRSSWMDETLERLDYDGRVVPLDCDLAHVNRLVVPSFPDPTPEECQWLRERMGADSDGDSGNRIYVSRADATIRNVENIDDIERVLDEHGIETYVLSELSVAEQITLFANAELVVAPHGAGLANLVYAHETSVIELFGDEITGSFARLAEMLDHEYTFLDCEQRGVNLVVDPECLNAAIERFVGM